MAQQALAVYQNFLYSVVSQLGDPGFRPQVRPLTRESGLVD